MVQSKGSEFKQKLATSPDVHGPYMEASGQATHPNEMRSFVSPSRGTADLTKRPDALVRTPTGSGLITSETARRDPGLEPHDATSIPEPSKSIALTTPRSLPLSPALRTQQAQALKRRISPLVRGELEVHITDNRTVMISVKRDVQHRRYRIRLHHLFVDAPMEILEAVARYIVHNDRTASRELGSYIERCDHRVATEGNSRRTIVRTQGRFHDLAAIFTRLERRYCERKLEVGITWGRQAALGRARGSIRLGSYTLEDRLIRIHPGLDQAWVPERYVAWVIYHEMLHALHPIDVINGRRHFHTPAFQNDERRYEHYHWARTWEQRNIAALLSL